MKYFDPIIIKQRQVKDLSTEELTRLKKLTHKFKAPSSSLMLSRLNEIERGYKKSSDYSIFIAMDGDKIVGWSIVSLENFISAFYVSYQYRRQGIGTKLYNKTKRLINVIYCERMRCCPHNTCSLKFFRAVGAFKNPKVLII